MSSKPIAPLDLIVADSLLSEEERAIRETVRTYLEAEVAPHISAWFEAGELPVHEVAAGLGQLGLLGMHLDGYGCAGMSAVSYGLACMELEAIDSGLRSLVSVQGSLAMFAIWKFGSEEHKQEWLPQLAIGRSVGCFGLTEADFGSDPAGMRTFAKRDGSDWVLSGSKMWITNGTVADVAVVWANTQDGIRGFVVPTATAGFSANAVKHKLSLRASDTAELVLDNVRLPESAMLPEVQGLKGPLSCLSEARFGIVFGVVGAARDCLSTAIDYSLSRQQFGQPIAGFQLTQKKIADMSLELQKAYLLALHLGRLKDNGQITPAMVSVGKLNNVREALAIAHESRSILGGNGITLEYSILRHANNLESVLTYEGTTEIHTLVVGEALTGIGAYK
jgi:glutaryl-CoA dehydrogenase